MSATALPAELLGVVDEVEVPGAPVPLGDVPRLFVVPAYNEEQNLPRLLLDLERRPELFAADGSKVIVVDDGSSDATTTLARAYEGPLRVELVELGTNQGPGAAFRAGFRRALAESAADAFVITLEADTTSDLDALPEMLQRASTEADLVLASVHGGGRMRNVTLRRRVLSRSASFVVRHALGIDAMTVSSFFRIYRASLLRRGLERYGDDLIQEPGFACKAEILAKLAAIGARVVEVPVDVDAARRVDESKMSVRETLAGYARLIGRSRSYRPTAK
jgi:dolichol-phosphate mannosyltransferase